MRAERGMTEPLGEQLAGASQAAGERGHGPKKTSPGVVTGARIARCGSKLRAILPIHGEGVAALVAPDFLRLPRDVSTLVTPGAHEVRLVYHAPRLGPILPDLDGILGNADFDLVHVQNHPLLVGSFNDPVPRTPPQAFLFRAVVAAPGPSNIGHELLHLLGGAFPHEHEDRRLRDRKSVV